ncbi:hypothetical protein C2S51_024865 [Perilla frutescens var. frutescens]|nr:hypothetical protein C2S51_024865 [Perilla frutescens var. frutescens]
MFLHHVLIVARYFNHAKSSPPRILFRRINFPANSSLKSNKKGLTAAIRTPNLDSTFERRLRSHETSRYKKLILHHIDLEIFETRLKEGGIQQRRTPLLRFNEGSIAHTTQAQDEAIAAPLLHCCLLSLAIIVALLCLSLFAVSVEDDAVS